MMMQQDEGDGVECWTMRESKTVVHLYVCPSGVDATRLLEPRNGALHKIDTLSCFEQVAQFSCYVVYKCIVYAVVLYFRTS